MARATTTDSVQLLRQAFSAVLEPGQPGYDEARRIHNGLIDKRPALIARCLHTADVVAAVDFARDEGLEISVRGGGHNVAGKAVIEGGLMIDLSLMKGVQVDMARRTVRAQAGVTSASSTVRPQSSGWPRPSGMVSSTGIAGLTLGGGLGWLRAGTGWRSTISSPPRSCSPRATSSIASGDKERRAVLGDSRGRRELRRGHLVRVPRLPGRERAWRRGAWPLAAAPTGCSLLPRVLGRLPDELSCRPSSPTRPMARGRSSAGLSICHCGRRRRAGRCRPAAAARVRVSVADMVQRMPYPVVNTGADWLFRGAA